MSFSHSFYDIFYDILTDFNWEIFMKKLLVVALAGMFVLTGCNTIKGFGKDVSKTGEAVTGSAQKVQNKI